MFVTLGATIPFAAIEIRPVGGPLVCAKETFNKIKHLKNHPLR